MANFPDFGTVPTGNWVAVVCAAQIRQGLAGGFLQVDHGKAASLQRIRPGDRVVCYAPTEHVEDRAPLQAFTAIGTVRAGEPYTHDIGNGFCPSRRNVAWVAARDVSIKPLLDTLDFTAGDPNWGDRLRFGLFAIGARDLEVIAIAMGAGPGLLKPPRPSYAVLAPRPVDLLAQNHHL